jgi:hypothetical protein
MAVSDMPVPKLGQDEGRRVAPEGKPVGEFNDGCDERVVIAGTARPLRKAGKHEMSLRDATFSSVCCTGMDWHLLDPR